MSVGMPGAAVGGLFYIVSALCMPLRESLYSVRGGRAGAGRWRVVARQAGIAAGIVAVTWLAGAALGLVVGPPAPAGAGEPRAGAGLAMVTQGHLLRQVAILMSLVTLCVVLLGVQVLRLVVRARQSKPSRFLVALGWLGILVGWVTPATAASLAGADSLFAAGELRAARQAYRAVLDADPGQSRAVYQLAQLVEDEGEAEKLLRCYVALEPGDAWGHMALGDLLGESGRYDESIRCYDAALELEPRAREIVLGRARWLGRAGRTDAAIARLEEWLARNPEDGEAWTALGAERQKAGRLHAAAEAFRHAVDSGDPRAAARLDGVRRETSPAVQALVAGSRDSDGNGLLRTGIGLDLALPGRSRLGVSAGRTRVEDALDTQTIDELALEVAWRPRAALRLQLAPGVARVPSPHPRGGADDVPTFGARVHWRASGAPAAIDLRFAHELLAVSPLLVESRVLRTEARAGVELPVVGRLRLRGTGRFARLESRVDTNSRRALQGGLVAALRPGFEIAAQVLDQRYDHPSSDGYFAPQRVQLAEGGLGVEREALGTLFLALDVGAGLQRITTFDALPGPWEPAFRLWAQLGLALGAGCRLSLECEAYDSQSGTEATASSAWRYGFAAASLRVPMP